MSLKTGVLIFLGLSCLGLGLLYGNVGVTTYQQPIYNSQLNTALFIIRLFYFSSFPYLFITFIALISYIWRPRVGEFVDSLTKGQRTENEKIAFLDVPNDRKIYMRLVTRGNNPDLILFNTQKMSQQLERYFHLDSYCIEVVTEKTHSIMANPNVCELIVPASYSPVFEGSPTKFKARALQYALETSPARNDDWIVHLDEETLFDDAFLVHLVSQMKEHRHSRIIFQGLIRYLPNSFESKWHFICTLADSLRVTDDLSRFRLQFEWGKCWFGIKGSFIVLQNHTEKEIGFNYGLDASITEDAFFALMSASKGIRFGYFPASMQEKSPFSLLDFLKQRRRWFSGLWKVCTSSHIQLKHRIGLILMMISWVLSPLGWLPFLVFLVLNYRLPVAAEMMLGCMFGLFVFVYVHGLYMQVFFCGKFVWSRWQLLGMFLLQILLIPLFCLMESAGIVYAIFCPPRTFEIVQKQTREMMTVLPV